MLAGQLSNQDEDEVEVELESLQRQVEGPPVRLPDAPVSMVSDIEEHEAQEEPQEQAAVPLTS